MSSQVLLEVREVSKIYGSGPARVFALRGASLQIFSGELLMIVGASGSGKSTLLNLIGGMDRPTEGQLLFDGKDLSHASESQLTSYRRHHVGFVFQFYNLVPTLTALENVEVAVQISENPMDAREALRIVGLEERCDAFPSQLSGGQQQRVALARALAGNPRLLLCDEPTGNLDSQTGRQVLELLVDVNERLKMTVVVITHSVAVARIGHRVATLRDGQIVSVGENRPRLLPREIEW